jgi:hypothetical protein
MPRSFPRAGHDFLRQRRPSLFSRRISRVQLATLLPHAEVTILLCKH